MRQSQRFVRHGPTLPLVKVVPNGDHQCQKTKTKSPNQVVVDLCLMVRG